MIRGLIVSQFPTLPATQGNRLRLLSACRELQAAGMLLDFLYYPREDGALFDANDLDLLSKMFANVFIVPSDDPWPGFAEKHQRSEDIYNERVAQYYKFVSARIHYDFVYVNYAPYAHLFRHCSIETIRVLDTHDKLADRRDSLEMLGNKPDFFSLSIEDESSLCRQSDLIIAIKESEYHYYSAISSKPVLTVGVAIDDSHSVILPPRMMSLGDKITFGFIGSDNAVNRLALIQLYALLVEKVRLSKSSGRYLIVGRVVDQVPVPSEIADIVTAVRFVNELAEFYGSCDVVLIPTIKSTGLKIKSIEALSYGKAIIATADGFDGLGSKYNFHNCSDLGELLDYCDDVAGGALSLSSLIAATAGVARSYMLGHQRNMNALIKACSKYRVLIVVPRGPTSVSLYAFAFSLLFFLKRRCDVVVCKEDGSNVDPYFLSQVGAAPELSTLCGGASRSYEVVIHSAAMNEQSLAKHADVLVTPLLVSRESNGVRMSSAACGKRKTSHGKFEKWFPSVRLLDYVEQPYWGPRRRLLFVCAALEIEESSNWLKRLSGCDDFRLLSSDYSEVTAVSFDSENALSILLANDEFLTPAFPQWLFDNPWNSQKHLVLLGEFSQHERDAVELLFSVPNTVVFVDRDGLIGLVKIICGTDVTAIRFSNPETLCRKIAWINNAPNSGKPVLSRYMPNRGAMRQVVNSVKEVLTAVVTKV